MDERRCASPIGGIQSIKKSIVTHFKAAICVMKAQKRYNKNDATAPRTWVSLLAVFLLAVMLVLTAKIALNNQPKRSDFSAAEKAAAETYNQYSLRLEAIKKECLVEFEAIADED